MAFTSIAALVAGEAATTTLVLGAVSELGIAMTVVGAVTGNKALMKVGGVLGLVGGVGGMIAGSAAGGAADAAASASPGEADSVLASQTAAQGGVTGASSAGAMMSPGQADADLAGQTIKGVQSGGDLGSVVNDAQQSLGETAGQASKVADVSQGATNTATTSTATPTSTATSTATPMSMTTPTTSASDVNGMDLNSDIATKTGAAPDGSVNAGTPTLSQLPPVGTKDYFSNFLTWVKNNQQVANGMLTLGSGALKGMADQSMFAQKMALEKMKYGHGNEVASYGPRALIGGH